MKESGYKSGQANGTGRTGGLSDAASERMPMPARPPRTAGFTLIELLVVLGIIGVLMAILLPALSAARFHAAAVQGLSNLGQIGRAVLAYVDDHERDLPVGYVVDPARPSDDTNWTTLLHGYLSGGGMTDVGLDPSTFLPIFIDPNAALRSGRVHYSAHPALMPDLTRDADGSIIRPIKRPYPVDRLVRGAQIVLVMDGSQDPANQSNSHATVWRMDGERIWDQWIYDAGQFDNGEPIAPGPNVDAADAAGHIRWRQPAETANFLYADGHAATKGQDEITKASVRVD